MSGGHFDHPHPEAGSAGGAAAGSLLYAAPAGVKLSATLALVVGTMLIPQSHAAWLILVAGLLLLAMAFSLVSFRQLARRIRFLAPFLLFAVLGSVLRPGSAADWRLVAARSALCLTAAVLLSETTTLGSILNVLRRIGVPALLITTMALMNRYLFVLADEMVRMRRARASRTFAGGRRFTWQVLATVAGRLFERAAERSDRIYAAMCARGWR